MINLPSHRGDTSLLHPNELITLTTGSTNSCTRHKRMLSPSIVSGKLSTLPMSFCLKDNSFNNLGIKFL